jgi:hypothetical protein
MSLWSLRGRKVGLSMWSMRGGKYECLGGV